MVKNVGKIILLVALLCSQVYAASIVLHICDAQGNELEAVEVGQPFVLKVSMEGFKNRASRPIVPHLECMKGEYAGEGHSSQNGHLKSYFTYVGRIDTEGSYTIGPVNRDHEGAVISSNTLIVKAGAEAALRNPVHKKKRTAQPVLVRFSVDNERVVVGQKIVCTVRFYYAQDSGATGEAQINLPALSGFVVGKEECVDRGTTVIQGVTYQFIEWQWYIYPEEAGIKMIPACGVDFVAQVVSQRSLFRFAYQDIKRVHSNVIHLTVDPVPPHETPVAGVGEFNKLSMAFEPISIKEGEAAVLTVEIHGNGNSEMLPRFILIGMPDAVKYYESKTYTKYVDNIPVRCFEFVIQGLRAGDWEVPAQQFVYFDVRDNAYQTLRAQPISFSIMPAQGVDLSGANNHAVPTTDLEIKGKKQENVSSDSALALCVGGPWYPTKEKTPLPLWFFLLAIAAPLVGVICYASALLVGYHYVAYERVVRSRRAFIEARAKLKEYKEKNNTSALYALFISLIAYRCMVSEGLVSRSWIYHLLEKKQCTVKEREEWEKFLDKLSSYSFAQTQVQVVDKDIYVQVEQWISWLEKKI